MAIAEVRIGLRTVDHWIDGRPHQCSGPDAILVVWSRFPAPRRRAISTVLRYFKA